MLKKSKILIKICIFFGFFVLLLSDSWAAPDLQSKSSLEVIQQLENTVSNVTDRVGKTVVGISTERNRQITSYFRNYGNETFNEFFRTFFFGDATTNEYKQIGLGSGVIISSDGYILTNEHVIAGADKISVTMADGREFPAKLKGAEYRLDIALLKIDALDLPYADLGDSDSLRIGQFALAVGNPFSFALSSFKPAVSFGIISALERTLPKTDTRSRAYLDLIQTDATINPGNSGGPLLNIHGEIIGINVAISGGSSNGVYFAIPINDAKSIVYNLLRGEKVLNKWVGLDISDINYIMAESFDLKNAQGALVLKVLKGSSADIAGLRVKDIILKFNSEKVESTLGFVKKLGRVREGDEIRLRVLRNSLPRVIKIKLGKIPKELESLENLELLKNKRGPSVAAAQDRSTDNSKEISKTPLKTWRGMKVAEITKEFANNFEIDTDIGVIVTKVIEGSQAEQAGIRVKDIITQINNFNIQTLEDYLFATSKTSGKVLIKTNRAFLMIHD